MMLPEKIIENHIARIEEKKSMILNPFVLSNLNKHEIIAAKASIGKPIMTYSEEELRNRVAVMVLHLFKDLGIKTSDEDELKYYGKRFIETLRDYYSNFTLEQVSKAFQLLSYGALDEFLPNDKNGNPDRNHYQSFSVDFITKVLRAFQEYNNRVWSKAQKAIPEPERIFSEEEREAAKEAVKLDIIEKFERFKKEGILSDFVAPFLAVRVLHQNSIIVEICPISDSDKRKSLMIVQLSNSLNEFEKNEIRRIYESGGLHPRHKAEAERVRDLNLIRETFERIDKLEIK